MFFQILKIDLDSLAFTLVSTLFQYIDDLFLCNKTKQGALIDFLILLKTLPERGHKAPRSKFQWVKITVTYLGHEISQDIQKLTLNALSQF